MNQNKDVSYTQLVNIDQTIKPQHAFNAISYYLGDYDIYHKVSL